MIGFWVFFVVVIICVTVVVCVFLNNANENFNLWATKNKLDDIINRLERIEEALAKMGE